MTTWVLGRKGLASPTMGLPRQRTGASGHEERACRGRWPQAEPVGRLTTLVLVLSAGRRADLHFDTILLAAIS